MVFSSSRLLQSMIIFSCLIFSSCKKTDKILFSYIDSANPQRGLINMKDALKVDYDTAFLFLESTTNKDIETVLEMPYPRKTFLQDSEYKLILLRNHEIVYDNSFYCKRVEFFFYNPKFRQKKNDVGYIMWTDSIFEVSFIKMQDGSPMYQLQPYSDIVDSM